MMAHERVNDRGNRSWCNVGLWRWLKAKIQRKPLLRCASCGRFVATEDVSLH